jgi:hypothetical protein
MRLAIGLLFVVDCRIAEISGGVKADNLGGEP